MKKKCNIVRDLIPLVVEDMASEDSVSFVNEHINTCVSCRAEYKRMKNTEPFETSHNFAVEQKVKKRTFQMAKRKFTRHAQLVSFGVLLIALVIGLSLTAGMEMFFNALIMPIVGVLGYIVFRWKALYKMPALLLILDVVVNFIAFFLDAYGYASNYIEFSGFALYALIYIVFMCVGILIAGLLHFAFKKEEK